MATHEVSLNITKPVPIGSVDIEIPVRRNGRAFGKVKISKGAIDWMPANKSKTAYYMVARCSQGGGRMTPIVGVFRQAPQGRVVLISAAGGAARVSARRRPRKWR
jgi:hypothetical protein